MSQTVCVDVHPLVTGEVVPVKGMKEKYNRVYTEYYFCITRLCCANCNYKGHGP